MDDPSAEELVFSANFACSVCGYSMMELEPRLFSFNNPAGACPSCDGLGVQQFFDPERVIQNTEISLSGGAIRGWDRRNFYYFQMIMSLAEHYKFDAEAPYSSLSPAIQKLFYTVQAKKRSNLNIVTTVAMSLFVVTHLKGCSIIWSAVIKKQNPLRYVKNSPNT